PRWNFRYGQEELPERLKNKTHSELALSWPTEAVGTWGEGRDQRGVIRKRQAGIRVDSRLRRAERGFAVAVEQFVARTRQVEAFDGEEQALRFAQTELLDQAHVPIEEAGLQVCRAVGNEAVDDRPVVDGVAIVLRVGPDHGLHRKARVGGE